MIIKNNKKCNIKINDKNVQTCKKINISDYVPELKEFEKNGLRLATINGNNTYQSYVFEKRIEDKSIMSVCVTIFFEEGRTYSKKYVLDLLKSQLEGFYDKK